ncbi:phytanoyl-CoA dioxygenase family protein [Novosphingobium sp. YAF33]|uniref:phytanoyl-CoA dioxygenase family protein n=1 Tax=Novosphingobium sp. YAF33 TaxID=3233082 RepID=UPI003F9B3EBC
MADVSEVKTSLGERDGFAERFFRDGLLIVENAFSEADMALIEAAWQGNFDNPSALAQHLYAESGGTFIQSVEDSSGKPAFAAMFRDTPVIDIARDAFGSGGVWYFHDQLFFKQGAVDKPVRRTPWHQDTPYHPIDGSKFVVFWIPLQDIAPEYALEVVRGSHTETLYNGSYFDPSDDTLPVYDEKEMPRLPDVEANRDAWDIVTCGMRRGDPADLPSQLPARRRLHRGWRYPPQPVAADAGRRHRPCRPPRPRRRIAHREQHRRRRGRTGRPHQEVTAGNPGKRVWADAARLIQDSGEALKISPGEGPTRRIFGLQQF